MPGSPPFDGQVPNAAGVVGTGVAPVPPVPAPPGPEPPVAEPPGPDPPGAEPPVPVLAPLPPPPIGGLTPTFPSQAISPEVAPKTASARN